MQKKKAAKQKTHSKKQSAEVVVVKKVLGDAPEEKHFILSDGRKLKSVFELIDELETMGEETFRHHVNEHKNDFSNWIRDVFEEKSIAEEVHRIQNRTEAQRALMKSLVREIASLAEDGKKSKAVKCVIK